MRPERTDDAARFRLRHSAGSPFVRKVVVFAHECGLADRIEFVPTDTFAADSDLPGDNPLGKVPALLTPQGVLPGSLLCCQFLDTLHGRVPLIPQDGPGRWRVLRLHALADGMMEAAVAAVIERVHRPQAFVHDGYVGRQLDRIRRTLAAVAAEFPLEADYTNIAQITLGCALGYLDIRVADMGWRDRHPRLSAWQDVVACRGSMRATLPRPRVMA